MMSQRFNSINAYRTPLTRSGFILTKIQYFDCISFTCFLLQGYLFYVFILSIMETQPQRNDYSFENVLNKLLFVPQCMLYHQRCLNGKHVI